ncbi:MAG: DEAD/DEAH box helicase family protein [Cetobacterium sp.]
MIRAIVDTVKFARKPDFGVPKSEKKVETGGIQDRLKRKVSKDFTIKELTDYISQGCSVKYGEYERDFKLSSRDIFIFDIDSGDTIKSWEDMFELLGIDILFIYKTFSHTEEVNRFRIAIRLSFPITSKQYYEQVFNEFELIFKEFKLVQDLSLKDWTKLVFGSAEKMVYVNEKSRPLDLKKFFEGRITYTRELQESERDKYIIDRMYAIKKRESFNVKGSGRELELNGAYNDFKSYLMAYFATYGKPEYELALKWASGLANAKFDDLYYQIIPEHKQKEYIGFERTLNNEKIPFFTKFFKYLYEDFLKKNYSVEKYLSNDQIDMVLKTKEKEVLVIAPTGSGKTHGFVTRMKETNTKFIIAVPSVALAQQGAFKYQIHGAFGSVKLISGGLAPNFSVSTYNKIASDKTDADFSEHILMIDECHLLALSSDYRAEVIYNLMKNKDRFKKIIFVTATAECFPTDYFEKVIEFKSEDTKKYEVKFIKVKGGIANAIPGVIKNSRATKFLVFNPMDKEVNDLLSVILPKSLSLNADTKDKKEHQEFVRTGMFPKGKNIIIATDIFSAGLNIEETDERVAVITSGTIDKSTLKQLVARYRNSKTIEIYYMYSKDRKNNDYKILDYLKKEVTNNLETYNQLKHKTNTNRKAFELKDEFYKYEDGKFVIFEQALFRKAYKTYSQNCSLEHLFELFPKESVFFEYGEIEIEKESQEIKKRGRKTTEEKEVELRATFSLLIKEEFDEVDSKILEEYNHFLECGLTKELAAIIASKRVTLDSVRYKVLNKILRSKDKMLIVSDKFYNLTKYISNLRSGMLIHVGDIHEKYKWSRKDIKECINSIWEVEEVKDNKKRYYKLIKYNDELKFINKKDLEILVKNKFILGLEIGGKSM